MLIPLKVGQQYMPETLKAVLSSLYLNVNVYNIKQNECIRSDFIYKIATENRHCSD